MKKTALVIMAAGIGSRFGEGIKQLTPVDDYGHVIMDYSVYDAIEAGFNEIIFIIRKDIEEDFKEIIGDRIEKVCASKGVDVKYCFQVINNIPGAMPVGRTKPWGTGQAVLAAEPLLDSAFTVINADDYYGKEAFVKLHDWLIYSHTHNELAMAGFILKNTLSDNGGVTRGICQVNAQTMTLSEIVETHNIVKSGNGAEADGKVLNPDSYVSMNMWGFPTEDETSKPAFLQVLKDGFVKSFETDVLDNPMKAEYLLPVLIGDLLKAGTHTVEVLPTQDKWFGVTYAEDKQSVYKNFKELISRGVYGKKLA
jgi:UTP-glucose-1-phosphate uridylyltransferase